MRAILAILVLLALPHAAATCTPRLSVTDAARDQTVLNTPANSPLPESSGPVDLRWVNMTLTATHLEFDVGLDARPSGAYGTYRYWVGWSTSSEGQVDEMDVRIAGTATYDEGLLVGPSRLGLPDGGNVRVNWTGSTMHIDVPRERLETMFSDANLTYGSPRIISDGPSATTKVQEGVFEDWMMDGLDYQPLPTCPAVATLPPASGVPGAQAAAGPSLTVVVPALAALALRRRTNG